MRNKALLERGFLVFVVLVAAACNSGGGGTTNPPAPPPGPPAPPPPPPAGTCAITLTQDITVPSRMGNSAAECDYLVKGDIEIKSALTIEPGTVVQFDQDARLMIDDAGSLTVVGTAQQRIRLEGRLKVKGYWYGLCFGRNRESRLEFVDLLWGGKVWSGGSSVCRAGIGGVSSNGEPIHIKNTLISGSFTSGLDAKSVVLGEFASNVFANNIEYGVLVGPDDAHQLDGASDYLGTSVNAPNGKPYVFFSGLMKGDGSSRTWRKLNAPYYTGDSFPYGKNIIVDEPIGITIEAGARFEFGPEGGLNFWDGASLKAIGTPNQPIVFTGKNKTAGSWEGLSFSTAGSSVLDNVEVSFGGADGLYAANVDVHGVDGTEAIVVKNSKITDSATCGILDDNSTVQESGNTFSNNADGNVCR